jgi:HEAT repeat protein
MVVRGQAPARRPLPRASTAACLLTLVSGVSALLVAVSAGAQISANQVRDRYERNTKGSSIDDYVRRLNGTDPAERLEAVRSLGESKDSKAIEYLIQALGDSDMRIKAKAIDALGDMRATDATPVLIQQLFLRDSDVSVKRRILASLGKIGDVRSAKPIMEFLQRDLDADTRGTAIYALGDIGASESLEMLVEIEESDTNPTMRRLARQAVSKVNHHQAMLKTEAKQPLDTFLRPDEPRPQQ